LIFSRHYFHFAAIFAFAALRQFISSPFAAISLPPLLRGSSALQATQACASGRRRSAARCARRVHAPADLIFAATPLYFAAADASCRADDISFAFITPPCRR
jgi:hypothetical protein